MPTISVPGTQDDLDLGMNQLIRMNLENVPDEKETPNDSVANRKVGGNRDSRSLTFESDGSSDFENDMNHINFSRNIGNLLSDTNPNFSSSADELDMPLQSKGGGDRDNNNKKKNNDPTTSNQKETVFFGPNTDPSNFNMSGSLNMSSSNSAFRRRRLTNAIQGNFAPHTPMFQIQKRVFRAAEIGDEPSVPLPFHNRIVGTFSCHGIEPSSSYLDERPFVAKTNQDRGAVVYPFKGDFNQALFSVFDGHGEVGDKVSEFAMYELPKVLESHDKLETDIETAFKDAFVATDRKLITAPRIEPLYSGSTAVVALVKDREIWVANAGDSRCTMATLTDNYGDVTQSGRIKKKLIARDLSVDQNPDSPDEMKRILDMGGYVSPRPEPELSARVWLDPDFTQVGLAMARSIGDHAVKGVGVIAEPEVLHHRFSVNDKFLIFASDGVWEFISSQEAVDIVAEHLLFDENDDERDYLESGNDDDDNSDQTRPDEEKSEESKEEKIRNEKYRCNVACQRLIEIAAQRWRNEEGDYRDDITCFVVRIPALLAKTSKASLEELQDVQLESQKPSHATSQKGN